jgi:uncharacterized protein
VARSTRVTPIRRPLANTVVADTGALYALIDRDDAWHARVRDWWAGNRQPLVVPSSVLPEVTYLVDATDLERTADIMHAYADFPLGFVDASVVAVAERLGALDVLTTDRRHFGAVRPRHVQGFRLVP